METPARRNSGPKEQLTFANTAARPRELTLAPALSSRLAGLVRIGYLAGEICGHLPAEEGDTMSVDSSKGHPAMDYAQHKATYAGFIRGSQIGVVLLVILMVGMFLFLT